MTVRSLMRSDVDLLSAVGKIRSNCASKTGMSPGGEQAFAELDPFFGEFGMNLFRIVSVGKWASAGLPGRRTAYMYQGML